MASSAYLFLIDICPRMLYKMNFSRSPGSLPAYWSHRRTRGAPGTSLWEGAVKMPSGKESAAEKESENKVGLGAERGHEADWEGSGRTSNGP